MSDTGGATRPVSLTSAPESMLAGTPAASPSPSGETQPMSYSVKRWDGSEAPIDAPAAEGIGPSPAYDPSAATMPIVPPPVPPSGSIPYGSARIEPSAYSGEIASPTSGSAATPRNDGGTYVPYSAEVARQLEESKPKDQRSWLIPSVVVAGLLLVLMIGGGFFLLGNNTRNPSTSPNATASDTPEASSILKTAPCSDVLAKAQNAGVDDPDSLKAIICRSNDEQIRAWRDLNIDVLKGTRTGQALQENIDAVRTMKAQGMYGVPDNKKLTFGDVNITGNTATAKTVEVWTVSFYSLDNKEMLQSQGPDTLRETYYFEKVEGKWLIKSVDIIRETPDSEGDA